MQQLSGLMISNYRKKVDNKDDPYFSNEITFNVPVNSNLSKRISKTDFKDFL